MNVLYYYCSCCGYENYNIFVAYSRQVANGELCLCPLCKHENFVETNDND